MNTDVKMKLFFNGSKIRISQWLLHMESVNSCDEKKNISFGEINKIDTDLYFVYESSLGLAKNIAPN